MTEPFATLVIGIFGLFFGSFLHVIYSRFGDWRSIITTRSHCSHCKTTLGAFELIPVLSYLAQGGKCKHCHKPITPEYPLFEILTGVVSALIWWHEAPNTLVHYAHTISLLLFAYTFLVMILQDRAHMEVSDLLFIALGVFGSAVAITGQHTYQSCLLGLLTAAGPLALLAGVSRERWMGWGDVFLALSVGLVLGYPAGVLWIYGAFMIGALWGVLLLAAKIKTRKDPVPFIPVLFASFLVSYLWGDAIISWYLKIFNF